MIGTAFNAMVTIMLAKFMLNDVPHYLFEDVTMRTLRVTRVDERDATPAQLRLIAIKSAKLKIPEPTVKYFGEAGLMIRELEAEEKHRKRLKSGNPGFVMFHATPKSNVDSILLSGLVPHPAFEGDEISAIYIANSVEKVKDYAEQAYSMGVSKENEWAIFRIEYDEFPGEVRRDLLWGLPGTYYTTMSIPPEHVTLVEIVDVSGNPTTATGTCYPDAWRFLMRQGEGYLVHGSVQLSAEGPRVNHAWFEFPSGVAWEPQTKQYFTADGFKMFNPVEEARYTAEQAAIMVARTGNHGPWSAEERVGYIGRQT